MNCGYFKNLLRLAWLFRRVAEGNKNQLHLTLLCFFVVVAAAAHCHFMAKSTLATHTHTWVQVEVKVEVEVEGRKQDAARWPKGGFHLWLIETCCKLNYGRNAVGCCCFSPSIWLDGYVCVRVKITFKLKIIVCARARLALESQLLETLTWLKHKFLWFLPQIALAVGL